MVQNRNPSKAAVKNAPRRVPALLTYISPFRIVPSDTLPILNPTIEQVNSRNWDYIGLHEIVGGVDVGLSAPYHLVVAQDGCLALPPLPEFRDDQAAIRFFNRCLAALLLGGVYCEAVSADGLDLGSVIDWKYVRTHQAGYAAPNQFHERIRRLQAAPMEAIALHSPATLSFATLSTAMVTGFSILKGVKSLRGEFLLNGVTGTARRDWGAALANLWIVVEQLLSGLWQTKVVDPSCRIDPRKVRRDQLNDTRTWTTSARTEALYQMGILDLETMVVISAARKARNGLSHAGAHPAQKDADAAYESVRRLMLASVPNSKIPLFDLDLTDHSLSDPFAPVSYSGFEPTHWMPIPKLPGEEELEKAEAAQRRRRSKD